MTPIQLNIVTGPGTSRREMFTTSPITFGRSDENQVVINLPPVSRRHGELRFEGGHWMLTNLSPNGTWVNGRRVSGRPRKLRDGDVMSVGDQPIMRVLIESATSAAATGEPSGGPPPGKGAPMTRRAKLWVGIGAYLLLLLALMVFLATLGRSDRGREVQPPLTPEQIERDVRRLPSVAMDARKSGDHLRQAQELLDKLHVAPQNLYRVYEHFQLALAFSGRRDFGETPDQLDYARVRNELTSRIKEVYDRGYSKLRTGDYRGAYEDFRHLTSEVYPRPTADSEVLKNIDAQKSAATYLDRNRAR